jgi:hypothetical protein
MLKKVFLFFVYGFAVFGVLLTGVFFAVRFGLTKESGIIDMQRVSFLSNQAGTEAPQWTKLEEWQTLREAILKDKEVINKASAVTGVPSRMIVAPLVVEQLRMFFDERELFKTVFAPLKILGVQSQFSWGVMGVKQETAVAIEEHLKDSSSPFYLGPSYEHLLDFSTDNPDQERFARLTDQHNRYYSYLYGALYIKELETQWKKAGFSISEKPEIVGTLYNIGFDHSQPNTSPQIGGAEISIGSTTYSFGALAADFYHSQELIEYFPN